MSSKFPIPPGVVARVVETAADPDATVAGLAKLIDKDAVLSAQVLKTVNSPFYGLRCRVASVERAVAFLGMRAVRNLVLSLGVRDLVPATNVGGFPIDKFWEDSLRRAAAAQCIAEHLEMADASEMFTIGLCLDLGVLLRVRDDESVGEKLGGAIREMSDRRLVLEQEDGQGHDELGFAMFFEWRFPEELSVPIRYHHRPDETPDPYRSRAQVAHAAEALADLCVVEDTQSAVLEVNRRLAVLGIGESAVAGLVDSVNRLVKEFAELLGLKVEQQPGIEQIIEMASRGLATLNLSYEETTRRLEQALAEQQRLASELETLNSQLASQARTDPLTGLANRRAFDDNLKRELAQAQRQRSALTLLSVDLDHFKELNDTYGHQAGDHVLKEVAKLLQGELRTADSVSRIGGEEFAILLPFTDGPGGKMVAERLRQGLARLPLQWGGQIVSVTASIGGCSIEAGAVNERTGEMLIQRADLALYDAKGAGRNVVCWDEAATPVTTAG